MAVNLVEQEDGRDVAERGLLAESVEGVEGSAAVGTCGEEDDVGGSRVLEEALDGALGVAEDQDAIAVLFEEVAKHVLHFYVGLDQQQLTRFALLIESFAARELFAGRLAFFAFFQALDR